MNGVVLHMWTREIQLSGIVGNRRGMFFRTQVLRLTENSTFRSRKRRNSGGSQESVQTSPSVDTRASEERREDDEGVGQAAGQLANE